MKLGVISDIHSNVRAFRACTDYMEQQGCDEYLLLGDFVSDTACPDICMDYLYQFTETHTCHILRGNREEYQLSQRRIRRGEEEGPVWFANSACGNLLYTYEHLREKDFDFFESLPSTFRYEKEGYPAIRCCHGSPDNSRELLQFGSRQLHNWLEKIQEEYLLCAHTHYPGAEEYGGKTYFNSGSAGIAIGDAGKAQCLILRSGEKDGKTIWIPEFAVLPYEVEEVIGEIFSSGLYDEGHWFINANIHILKTGIDKAAEIGPLAGKLMEEATGEKAVWPCIEDCYYAQAAEKLGIPEYGLCGE